MLTSATHTSFQPSSIFTLFSNSKILIGSLTSYRISALLPFLRLLSASFYKKNTLAACWRIKACADESDSTNQSRTLVEVHLKSSRWKLKNVQIDKVTSEIVKTAHGLSEHRFVAEVGLAWFLIRID